ncbi:FecR family protein [Sphingobium lignivorans]|uniref:Transmembrane sensor n=1 Tax=Sphingobium lignivorans TaxID=2735886 RepID=A0ABR6NH58_9SPHN|nr:FecR domain-containing protein [Sphingobium lignivorans]MBB5986623.1 transmembrane sensor [Sphingobium lignivorans]
MNEPEAPPAEPPEQLAREAATWFARMRGPDADAHRAAFDAWLAQGAAHRSAYNRAAEIFALGKLLAEPETAASVRRGRRPRIAALTAGIALLLSAAGWFALHRSGPDGPAPAVVAGRGNDTRLLSTVAGERRTIRLADGSVVRLEGDSMVRTGFSADMRQLRLERGSARFEVAHERRPFVVLAGGGSVTARGTIFEVALTGRGHVDVHLLQGAVDVALPGRNSENRPEAVRRLAAGERVSFVAKPPASGTGLSVPGAANPPPSPLPSPARDFTGIAVADLVAEANRDAVRPIRLADASLGARRVSGRFRVDDTSLLARRLAALFDGTADSSDPQEIVLRP